MEIKPGHSTRDVLEVGRGDYVKIGTTWKRIRSNSAKGLKKVPRNWEVWTEDGQVYDMWSINLYAKAEDLE